jgi:hypothetical protein
LLDCHLLSRQRLLAPRLRLRTGWAPLEHSSDMAQNAVQGTCGHRSSRQVTRWGVRGLHRAMGIC